MQPVVSNSPHTPGATPNPIAARLERILDPAHPLCKDDIVWVLEFIKKKVADKDPALLDLSQPRLLNNFHSFAEIAMLLIHRSSYGETERLRTWLYEAAHGLLPPSS